MQVRVRLFARLREQAGVEEVELQLAEGAAAADAYTELRRQHPGLEPNREVLRPARNLAFCAWEELLGDGDELALIPPVSGGTEGRVLVELTTDPLDPRRLEAAIAHGGAGGICTFTGVVRNHSEGRPVLELEYEAYPEMAAAGLRAIGEEITAHWPEARVAIAHRTGRLDIGDASVVVAVSCPHRAEAFEACRRGIDRLKATVPIWKKEIFEDGEAWVEELGPEL
jgi:MoaE-MoaD fusion protein